MKTERIDTLKMVLDLKLPEYRKMSHAFVDSAPVIQTSIYLKQYVNISDLNKL